MSKELKDSDANPLLGLELGHETDASVVGLSGKLKLTGGSDKSGVPMRNDIHGAARKYVLLSKGDNTNPVWTSAYEYFNDNEEILQNLLLTGNDNNFLFYELDQLP